MSEKRETQKIMIDGRTELLLPIRVGDASQILNVKNLFEWSNYNQTHGLNIFEFHVYKSFFSVFLTNLAMMIVGIFVSDFRRLLLIATDDDVRAIYYVYVVRTYICACMYTGTRISSRLVEIDRATTMF